MKTFNGIKNNNKAFAILFAVTLSAILLSIALGVSNIALKEVKFSTSARSTNDAFFAADTGTECALNNDKSTSTAFTDTSSGIISCHGTNISLNGAVPLWEFVISGLGSTGQSCAKVTVFKEYDFSGVVTKTTTTSKGYDVGDALCDSVNPERIERQIETTY